MKWLAIYIFHSKLDLSGIEMAVPQILSFNFHVRVIAELNQICEHIS